MTTPKNVAFIGLQLENCYLVGEIDFWWAGGGALLGRGNSSRWGKGMSKCSAGRRGLPPST